MVFTTAQTECDDGRKKVELQLGDHFLLRKGKGVATPRAMPRALCFHTTTLEKK